MQEKFVHVQEIVKKHWETYGRNYYCRYDYEGVDSGKASDVMNHIRGQFSTLPGQKFGAFTVATSDEFTYVDPIDESISRNQVSNIYSLTFMCVNC
jgi:phosphoglucomutase